MTIYHMPIYKNWRNSWVKKLGRWIWLLWILEASKNMIWTTVFNKKTWQESCRTGYLGCTRFPLSVGLWIQRISFYPGKPRSGWTGAGLLPMNQESTRWHLSCCRCIPSSRKSMVSWRDIEIWNIRAWKRKSPIQIPEAVIQTGEHADALVYELADMEKAINEDAECMHLDYTKMWWYDDEFRKNGISVSGGDSKLWYETHLSGDVQGVGFRYRSFISPVAQLVVASGGEPAGRKSGDEVQEAKLHSEMLDRIQQQRWINVADIWDHRDSLWRRKRI